MTPWPLGTESCLFEEEYAVASTMIVLAPFKTCWGSTRLCAFRSSQAISPCCFAESQSWNSAAWSGAAAVVKRQSSKPSSNARWRICSFKGGNVQQEPFDARENDAEPVGPLHGENESPCSRA